MKKVRVNVGGSTIFPGSRKWNRNRAMCLLADAGFTSEMLADLFELDKPTVEGVTRAQSRNRWFPEVELARLRANPADAGISDPSGGIGIRPKSTRNTGRAKG